ncbi:alpha/beta hydrolase [Jatrophihabitans sp. YIM 134969]
MHTEHLGPADDPQAPRALLVHGITSSAATMWELAEPLAVAGWAVTAVDLPGHGASGPASSYRFADVADAVHAEVGDGFDLYVGHSLGGAIGTELLARHPGVARRAVLIDPALVAPADAVAGLADQLVADKSLTADDVAAAHPHWHPRTVEARVAATAAADVEAVRRFVLDNQPWDVTAAAADVAVPVLVLVATDGSALAPFLLESLPAANPRWTFETVPDSSHSIHRDHPELVVQRLLSAR